ncbi:alpha/beta hydrolase family protein [Sphingomonas sp. CLY1604]|uniref:alpha/beta hydrolase family protein n=1 Tax=Sphingomonas sp. CLY1604 TaxID=3457786 RepID=UPI003FD75B92
MAGNWIPRDPNMDAPIPVMSVRSIRLPDRVRGEDLQVRVSAPVTGSGLPVILFSHGFGSSMDGYAPLTDYWAAHGFVVIQPTYLDARRLGLPEDDPRHPTIWRTRVSDAKRIIDELEEVIGQVPGLSGRVNDERLAAAGHSFGGQTTSLLLGARMVASGAREGMSDQRIKVGILLAAGGKGGEDLSPIGRQMTPYLDMSFDQMRTPTLIVAGDADHSPLTNRGPDWFFDPYYLAPGSKALLTLFGGEHMLGGISGYAVAETTDENPDRVSIIQRVTTAYLRRGLLNDASGWTTCATALAGEGTAIGKLEFR